jgi:hypothetical protein
MTFPETLYVKNTFNEHSWLPCPLHHPTAYNRQRRGHGFLPSAVLSHCVVVGDGT